MLSVRFWGVRGSLPCPGPDTVVFGGNTTCVEIRADDRLLIVDLGTGVRALGNWLMGNDFKKKGSIDADIFVTHTHWDHIMGYPLFTPIFIKGSKLRMWGPVSYEDASLESVIENQLSYRYWPVRAGELAAKVEYNLIKETTLDLGGGLKVTSKFLNHPVFCLGYRFDYQGKSIVAGFDHEPFYNLFTTDPSAAGYDEAVAKEGELAAAEENEKVGRFFQGADILIHDAQYTDAEYLNHRGWGHASYGHAIEAAVKANAKKLVLFHHDPIRTDAQLKELQEGFGSNTAVEIIMSWEGLILEA